MQNAHRVKLVKLASEEKYQRLLSQDLGTFGMKAGHVILKPGENIGMHSTGDREEVLVLLQGKGDAIIEKNHRFDAEPNTVLYIPPKTNHDVKNTGLGVLEYVYITSLPKLIN